MKFKCEHRFRNITLAQYEALYFDEAFNDAMCENVGLQRTLLKREQNGPRIHREVRVSPNREVPAPVAKILGSAKLEYVEHVDYTFGSNRGTWLTISSVMTDKLDTRGTMAFGEQGGSVVRTVEGDINVKIFAVGGVIEKFIVADVEKSYASAAAFTQQWIDAGKV